MRTELPAEGFLRHRGLILVAVGGAVAEGGLLTLVAPAARSVAPQVTALPSVAAYHDLRWLFTDSQSWLWFAGLVAALLVVRSALDVALLRLAWPRGLPRAEARPLLRVLRGADRAGLGAAHARGHAGLRRRRDPVLLALPRGVPDHARHRHGAQPRGRVPGVVAPAAAGPRGRLAARQLHRADRGRRGDRAPAGRSRRSPSSRRPAWSTPGPGTGLPGWPPDGSRAPTSRCRPGCCSASRSPRWPRSWCSPW